jgi:hypothetical protein
MLLSVLLDNLPEIRCIWNNTKVALQLSRIWFSQFTRSQICILSMSITLWFQIVLIPTPDRVIIDSCVTVRHFEKTNKQKTKTTMRRFQFSRRVIYATVYFQWRWMLFCSWAYSRWNMIYSPPSKWCSGHVVLHAEKCAADRSDITFPVLVSVTSSHWVKCKTALQSHSLFVNERKLWWAIASFCSVLFIFFFFFWIMIEETRLQAVSLESNWKSQILS